MLPPIPQPKFSYYVSRLRYRRRQCQCAFTGFLAQTSRTTGVRHNQLRNLRRRICVDEPTLLASLSGCKVG